jgi:hypothetical protein
MNGANAEPCVAISSTPNTSSMTKRGRSQSFFLTFKNWQNSLRNDMGSFQEPVYTGEGAFRMPPLCCLLCPYNAGTNAGIAASKGRSTVGVT